ncbi:acyl-CoA dehydrogenase family protein [Nocardioides insulae]|uniref:acyl-CoA dehydrogenase family protein n=1 Tax=Nocardioides insulae TaxID=394734 RepID=UPI00048D95DA|nr:acyl-CoA dehydrogenase family protein [Nocardioides insulae]
MSSSETSQPGPQTGFVTHEVFNQSEPRVGVNEYLANGPLQEAVAAFGAAQATDELTRFGATVGSAEYQEWARLANDHGPVLRTHDRWGHRIDEVEFHPSYHQLMSTSMAQGLHAAPWAPDAAAYAHTARAAAFMMANQIEPGHCCPISMTYAVVPSLRTQPDLAAIWEPRVHGRAYSAELADPATKPAITFGMAMTEKQGGSDVRANTTRAVPVGAGGPGEEYRITGHKWFCSAPMSDAFLVLARVSESDTAPSCFLVPRILPDGTRNGIRIQRLKNKLGNKSNASSEVEYVGASGWLVGEVGRGVRTIIEMVSHTRLDCVIGGAGGMRQGVAEALWHARHRSAFGALLVDQPVMTGVLADLALDSEAATYTALRLAQAHEPGAGEHDQLLRRIATPVAKYWVCKRGPQHAYESLECLGGNGYTEDFPLARRYREAPVLAVWEGSGNVIALDVLRAMQREPQAFEAFLDELRLASGENSRFDDHVVRVADDIARMRELPDPTTARLLTERMALGLQASLLLRHAPQPVGDAFVETRLSPSRGLQYGALPHAFDAAKVIERH